MYYDLTETGLDTMRRALEVYLLLYCMAAPIANESDLVSGETRCHDLDFSAESNHRPRIL